MSYWIQCDRDECKAQFFAGGRPGGTAGAPIEIIGWFDGELHLCKPCHRELTKWLRGGLWISTD